MLYSEFLTGKAFETGKYFSKAYIPLNSRSEIKNPECKVNENEIPCCPNDDSLLITHEGSSTRKNNLIRYKFVYPKIKWIKYKVTRKYSWQCQCDNPCNSSPCGRIFYIYPQKDLRVYLETIRGTEDWNNTYKIRTAIKRDINHIKDNLCLAQRWT